MSPSSRRLAAGLFRAALVVLAIVLVSGYVMRHLPRPKHMRVEAEVPPVDSLAPGDMRIVNADSSVDLILQGDKILAGLSPKTIAKVKGELDAKTESDSSGLGASISQIVKKSVAASIGTHAAFPLSDIKDIRYEHDQIVIDWKDGGTHGLFGNMKVNGSKMSKSIRREDAEDFIAAVRARMATMPAVKNQVAP
jgi:hypothetical protein